ncbi:hypothetical protein SK128_021895, partial [Halocaridina rubra]
MIGRAGRKGVDTQGESILICRDGEKSKAESLVTSTLPSITSCLQQDNSLTSSMKRAILEVIVSGIAATQQDVIRYSSCTLLAASINKETRLSQTETPNSILSCVQFLEENEFIRLQDTDNGVKYMGTQLGYAVLASGLSPDEGLHVFSELHRARQCFVLENELHIIYQVTPVYVSSAWPNMDWLNFLSIWESLSEDMKRVAQLVGVEESFLVKALKGTVNRKIRGQAKLLAVHQRFYTALALHELVQEVPLNVVANKYGAARGMLQSLQQSAATFAGMVTVFCNRLGWHNLELLVSQFHDRLHFGIQRELCDLVRLSCINGQRARYLYDAGLETISLVAHSTKQDIEHILLAATPFHSNKTDESNGHCKGTIWLSSGRPLTEAQAAAQILEEARQLVQKELGISSIDWTQKDRVMTTPNRNSSSGTSSSSSRLKLRGKRNSTSPNLILQTGKRKNLTSPSFILQTGKRGNSTSPNLILRTGKRRNSTSPNLTLQTRKRRNSTSPNLILQTEALRGRTSIAMRLVEGFDSLQTPFQKSNRKISPLQTCILGRKLKSPKLDLQVTDISRKLGGDGVQDSACELENAAETNVNKLIMANNIYDEVAALRIEKEYLPKDTRKGSPSEPLAEVIQNSIGNDNKSLHQPISEPVNIEKDQENHTSNICKELDIEANPNRRERKDAKGKPKNRKWRENANIYCCKSEQKENNEPGLCNDQLVTENADSLVRLMRATVIPEKTQGAVKKSSTGFLFARKSKKVEASCIDPFSVPESQDHSDNVFSPKYKGRLTKRRRDAENNGDVEKNFDDPKTDHNVGINKTNENEKIKYSMKEVTPDLGDENIIIPSNRLTLHPKNKISVDGDEFKKNQKSSNTYCFINTSTPYNSNNKKGLQLNDQTPITDSDSKYNGRSSSQGDEYIGGNDLMNYATSNSECFTDSPNEYRNNMQKKYIPEDIWGMVTPEIYDDNRIHSKESILKQAIVYEDGLQNTDGRENSLELFTDSQREAFLKTMDSCDFHDKSFGSSEQLVNFEDAHAYEMAYESADDMASCRKTSDTLLYTKPRKKIPIRKLNALGHDNGNNNDNGKYDKHCLQSQFTSQTPSPYPVCSEDLEFGFDVSKTEEKSSLNGDQRKESREVDGSYMELISMQRSVENGHTSDNAKIISEHVNKSFQGVTRESDIFLSPIDLEQNIFESPCQNSQNTSEVISESFLDRAFETYLHFSADSVNQDDIADDLPCKRGNKNSDDNKFMRPRRVSGNDAVQISIYNNRKLHPKDGLSKRENSNIFKRLSDELFTSPPSPVPPKKGKLFSNAENLETFKLSEKREKYLGELKSKDSVSKMKFNINSKPSIPSPVSTDACATPISAIVDPSKASAPSASAVVDPSIVAVPTTSDVIDLCSKALVPPVRSSVDLYCKVSPPPAFADVRADQNLKPSVSSAGFEEKDTRLSIFSETNTYKNIKHSSNKIINTSENSNRSTTRTICANTLSSSSVAPTVKGDKSSKPISGAMNSNTAITIYHSDMKTSIIQSNSFCIIDVVGDSRVFDCFVNEWSRQKVFSIGIACEKQPTQQSKGGIGWRIAGHGRTPRRTKPQDVAGLVVENSPLLIVGIAVCWGGCDAYYLNLRTSQTEPISCSLPTPPVCETVSFEERLLAIQESFRKVVERNATICTWDIKTFIKLMASAGIEHLHSQYEDPRIASWMLDPGAKELNIHNMVMNYKMECLPLLESLGSSWGLSSLGVNTENPGSCRLQVEIPCTVVLAFMELNGMGFSNKECDSQKVIMQARMSSLELEAYASVGHPFSLTSPDEISQVLYRELRLPSPASDSGAIQRGGKSKVVRGRGHGSRLAGPTNKEALEKLTKLHPLPSLILQWRKINSSLTKVVFPLQNERVHNKRLAMERIHPSTHIFTATGRVTMHEPNLQAVPRDFNIQIAVEQSKVGNSRIRREQRALSNSAIMNQLAPLLTGESEERTVSLRHALVAHSGNILLAADYSQLELRLMAHLASDEKLLHLLNGGEDVFKMIASQIHLTEVTEVSTEQRQQAKQVCYGIIYGIGAKSLGEQLDVDETEALKFMESFKRRFPGVQQFIQSTVEECRERGYVVTLMGRRRYLPNINSSNVFARNQSERQAVNTSIQGSAADLVKLATVHINDALRAAFPTAPAFITQSGKYTRELCGAFLVLQLHDELIYEVVSDDVIQVAQLVQRHMEGVHQLSVTLPVKIK